MCTREWRRVERARVVHEHGQRGRTHCRTKHAAKIRQMSSWCVERGKREEKTRRKKERGEQRRRACSGGASEREMQERESEQAAKGLTCVRVCVLFKCTRNKANTMPRSRCDQGQRKMKKERKKERNKDNKKSVSLCEWGSVRAKRVRRGA